VTRKWIRRLRRARELPQRIDALQQEVAGLREELEAERLRLQQVAGLPVEPSAGRPWRRNLLLPAPEVFCSDASEPFLAHSTPSVRDFLHPRFQELAAVFATPHGYHRKMWEWVYILNCALARGIAAQGRQAIGFGVGATEPIAAALARFGMTVTATDAPVRIGAKWEDSGQYAATADDMRHEGIVDHVTFSQRVRYERCDMRNIPARLSGYDFAWSSSSLEHLGTLRKGIDFVVNSVDRALKVGGVACHTTELNLTSNDETIEAGDTVIFRRRDVDELLARLREAGHRVDAMTIAPHSYPPDWWVDTPPYLFDPHLKLEFGGYAITSVAFVVQRGR
jgi:hypothetical protein